MRDHAECERSFSVQSQAYYARACREEGISEEIMVGFYHPDGGTTGEFAIRWMDVGSKPTARLEAFEDSWSALSHFKDLIDGLAQMDSEEAPPQRVIDLLLHLGIKDITMRTR